MKIKSAKSFRFWFKTKIKHINADASEFNENFVGTYHTENGNTKKGFFEMYHGDKTDIAGFLPSLLDIAEDGQAIFEFLQNAVDCDSTHFYIFYNERYFLVINNGNPFSNEDLKGILNIGQGTKLNQDCNKIGRFGIGFKLVHRLVGRTGGIEELTRDYKGPVLFSWHKPEQIKALTTDEQIEVVDYLQDKNNESLPWLLKILLTNFPIQPNEQVKNLLYKDSVLFPQQEIDDLRNFLKQSLSQHQGNINFNNLSKGSLFFIKLGEGKHQLLEKDYKDLRQGIQYSMNMLKNLQHIYINQDNIAKENLETECFEISIDSPEFKTIDPKYKDCNIKIVFGFFADYKEGVRKKIKEAPNFYKYFPMGDETNGFSFIIHSDSFSIEANRRKQHHDSINESLFPIIANFIIGKLDKYAETNRSRFLQIYACLLLSDIPNKQNNEWLKPIFYDVLLQYLKTNIPTQNNGFSNDVKNVKIKKLKIAINLSDFGLEHIQWFEWESGNDWELTSQAIDSNKLGLENWDIRDIIENAKIDSLNQWIVKQDNETYEKFLTEIENSNLRMATKSRLCEIKLFKCSNGTFYGVKELKKYSNLLFNFKKTIKVKSELESLGFVTSEKNISNYPNICSAFSEFLLKDKEIFDKLEVLAKKNNLNPTQKQNLFLNFINADTKFDDVAEATLKNLALFCNSKGDIKPLNKLVDSALITPTWLNVYKIKAEENFASLKTYLLSEKELYQEIILPNWDKIISEVSNVVEFYEKIKYYYSLKENMPLLGNRKFVYVNEKGFFLSTAIFYNSCFTKITNYAYFQNAIGCRTPHQQILSFLREAPFKIDDENFSVLDFEDDTQLPIEEIKALLEFCTLNRENFFEYCYVKKSNIIFLMGEKTKNIRQLSVPPKALKFVEDNLSDNFKLLPNELSEYQKNNQHIIEGESFYSLLLDNVDIDKNAKELIDIIAYNEPKRKFLLKLSKISFVADKQYEKESFKYKVLDLACQCLKETDYIEFRKKVVIKTGQQSLTLAQIPPFADKITIEGCELSLAKILPNNYQNSNYLGKLLKLFIDLGLSKDRVNLLFDINQEPEPKNIFALLSEGEKLLENEQQLAFLILYDRIEKVDFEKFEVKTLDGNYDLSYSYYTEQQPFINENAILSSNYVNIYKILSFPINFGEETQILKMPYFGENGFVCLDIVEDMSDTQKLSFVEFLFNQWDKKSKKIVIQNIDWSKINNIETAQILGFNPKYSVYPNEFALGSEQLPNYLHRWLNADQEKIKFLADLGVWTEATVLVQLRNYFANQGTFNQSKIAQESKFSEEKMLFNTFEWIESKKLELNNTEEFKVLEEMVRVINSYRAEGQELIIEEECDFELLENESTEWDASYYKSWKKGLEKMFSIYLFEGTLPKIIKLDKIEDYVFYRFNQGDIVIDDENNIYINRNADIKKALQSIVSDDLFTYEHLYNLFERNTIQVNNEEKAILKRIKDIGIVKVDEILTNYEEQKNKIEEQKNKIEKLEATTAALQKTMNTEARQANSNPTISHDEYFDEIKWRSEEYLFNILQKEYPSQIVKWLNYNEDTNAFEESWENHDFEILNQDGVVLHYIDCKGTPQQKRTFYLTENEWRFFLNCVKKNESYQIYRVFNVGGNANFIHIDNLWEWLKIGKVVPYLSATETIKAGRVFLTLK